MSRSRELALVGALLCATAASVGVPALFAPGIAALLATALAPLWVSISARHCELSLRCATLTAQEEERVGVRVTVRRGAIPFPGGTLLPWPGAPEQTLARSHTFELAGEATLPSRGRHTVGPARLRIADPFGLCSRDLTSAGSELLVLPASTHWTPRLSPFSKGSGASPRSPHMASTRSRPIGPGVPHRGFTGPPLPVRVC